MTGWHFRIGYLSGDSYNGTKDEAWVHLKDAAEDLVCNISKVIPGAGEFQTGQSGTYLRSALTVIESEREVMITASGDGRWKPWKERIARAFARALDQRMHDADIDICLEVA